MEDIKLAKRVCQRRTINNKPDCQRAKKERYSGLVVEKNTSTSYMVRVDTGRLKKKKALLLFDIPTMI